MLPGIALVAPPKAGSVTPVGNELKPANFAAAVTMLNSTAVVGDVINCRHAGYTANTGTGNILTVTRGFGSTGVTFIGNDTEPMRMAANGITGNIEWVGCRFWADATNVLGPKEPLYTSCDVDLQNCSRFAFRGCNFMQGEFGLMLRGPSPGCADIFVDGVNIAFARSDHIRLDVTNRVQITNFYIADACGQLPFWFKADNTTPIIGSAFQSGYLNIDPDHVDGLQIYTGPATDLLFQYGTLKAVNGQGFFGSTDDPIVTTRAAVLDCTILTANDNNLWITAGTECEFSRNTLGYLTDKNPASTNISIFARKAPSTAGNWKGGLNTYPGGTTILGDSGITFNGPITGTATAPTAPAFTGTTSNIVNLPTLRNRPSYTDYAGPPVLLTGPTLLWDKTSPQPWAAGIYLKACPGPIKGWLYSLPPLLWTRWKKDGTIQGSAAQGFAAMVSPVTTNGSWVAEQSIDSTNGTNGTWLPSTAVAIGLASGWNPSDCGNATRFNFSGTNNNIAARNATGSGSVTNVRGSQFRTTGRLYFTTSLTDAAFGDTDARVGIANSSAALTAFEGGANVAALNLSGNLGGNSTTLGTIAAKTDGFVFGWTIDLGTRKLWLKDDVNNINLLGGDPDSGGAGIDISYLIGALAPWLQTTTNGDNSTLNTTSATSKPTSATFWG